MKTHAKILIAAKRKGGSRRRRSRPPPRRPPPPPPRSTRGGRGGSGSTRGGRGGSQSTQGSSSGGSGRGQQQQQRLEHQQRVNRIRNDRTQTLAQRKEAIERENYRFRSQQQQPPQQQQQQQASEERIRRNSRDAKYTSRYMNQRRPRRYHRDGSTVIVAAGGGGYGGYGGYGGLPYYGGDGMASYGPEPFLPPPPPSTIPQFYTNSSGTFDGEEDDVDDDEDRTLSSTSVLDGRRPQRILNTTSLRRTQIETRTGEFRDIPALEGVDIDVINEYLRLRDAFDAAETSDDRIKTSVAFSAFTLKVDRIFKTHAYVYVRAMKNRPAALTTQDVETIIDQLSREEVERLSLLTNIDLQLFLSNQIK